MVRFEEWLDFLLKSPDFLLKNGWFFILKRLVFIIKQLFAKMSGALTWGLAELIEVELSALPSFQLRGSWGSPSATLGLVYAATGLGALLGPLVANSCGGEGSIHMGGSGAECHH